MEIKFTSVRSLFRNRQLMIIMRTFIFLFCTTLLAITPNNVISQNSKIKIEQDKMFAVDEIFDLIMEQTNYKFFYEEGIFKEFPKVHIKKGTIKTNKLLSLSLSKANLDIEVTNNNAIIIKKTPEPIVINKPQGLTITGTITDANGQPLPGTNIIVKGTTNGTQSDFDGKFSITVADKNAVLVASYLGFVTQEVSVKDQNNIKIILIEDASSLDEVVIVGYGTQRKGSITGSISTVKSEDLVKVPATNTTALLAGRLPGLVVTQNNGQPGGDQANISIRGFGSALVIVDGVPRDFQQLDPNEIESISILKDASAAVYGARAGNGVILVTTKRGHIGAPKINYSGTTTFQQPTFLPKIADAAGFARYQQQAQLLEGVSVANLRFSDEDIAKYEAGTENGFRGTDWQDVVLKDWATQQQHNINAQGGTERVKYFGSVGALNQNSLLSSGNGNFERYNIGVTLDAKITNRLDVGINLKYREENIERPSGLSVGGLNDNDNYSGIFRFLAAMDPTVQQNPNPNLLTAAHPLETNAVAIAERNISGINDIKRKQFDMILNFKYDIPVKGLELTGAVARQTAHTLTRRTRIPYTTYHHNFETGEDKQGFTSPDNDVLSISDDYTQTTTQIGLNYKEQFGDHNISATALLENRYANRYIFHAQRTDVLSSGIPYLFGATGTQTNNDQIFQIIDGKPVLISPVEDGRQGIVGRFNYNYQEKYLLEALFRADANIQFPTDTRWGYFPGVSLGWVVSKENFLKESSTLNYLKLRASFASLGFDDTSNFDYLSGYGLQNDRDQRYSYGLGPVSTTIQTIGLSNPFITWETMKTYNFGLDATFWNSLLGVELDVFYRKRSGLLRDRLDQFPDTFGADLPQENLGVRDNRGFELVVTHKNKIGDVNIGVTGNVTWTREKIIDDVEREFDLTDPDDARLNQNNGQWANRRFGYRTDGFYDTQDEIDNDGITYDPSFGEPKLGDVKYRDRNNDGNIDYRDQEIIGRNQTPELFFGLGLNADYKGFDFAMLWQGASNFDVSLNKIELSPTTSNGGIPFQYQVDNAWNAANPSAAKLPAPSTSGLNPHNDKVLDIYTRKGDYLRLKQITLGYSIPQDVLNKVSIRSVRIYLAAYNLLTIKNTGIFDFDPEARSGDGIATYPVQKNISLGINIGL